MFAPERAVAGSSPHLCWLCVSEIWEGKRGQVAALESIIRGGAKRILGCSSKTCNEAVRGDMGLESLRGGGY